MKPQKKVVVARKSAAAPNTAKKRRASPEKLTSEPPKRDKKTDEKKGKRVEVQVLATARKFDKSEELKKKVEKSEDKRKIEKPEDKKKMEKIEDKKKMDKVEERKRIGNDKPEEKRNGLLEKIEELKRSEESKKKIEKQEDKRKQSKDNEKKTDKVEIDPKREEEKSEARENAEKKKPLPEELAKNVVQRMEEKIAEENLDKTEKKKKDYSKVSKKGERKKSPEKENTSGKKSAPNTKGKKETKPKQPRKKPTAKSTTLVKKIAARSPPVSKKLLQTKMKLVKKLSNEDSKNTAGPEDGAKKSKKKCSSVGETKVNEKKPQLAKQMKSKVVSRKGNQKISTALSKKKEKMIKLAEKIVAKKKHPSSMQCNEITKNFCKEENTANRKIQPDTELDSKNIKRELVECNEDAFIPWNKSGDGKKSGKNICKTKTTKKLSNVRKSAKPSKARSEHSDRNSSTSDEVTLEDLLKQSKSTEETQKVFAGQSKQENCDSGSLDIDLKVETDDSKDYSSASATSDGEGDDENDEDGDGDEDNEDQDDEDEAGTAKSKKRNLKKRDRKSPSSDGSSERARRMRLFGFWSGPKRHRVASLNALAKVHCLYENEAGGVYLGGYCKPKPEKEKQAKKIKEDKEKENKEKEKEEAKEKDKKVEAKSKVVEISPKRKLRIVPGLRGKHWDMMESSSSSSSSASSISSDEEQRGSEERKNFETGKKKVTTKRRKKNEEVMDLKDMVVCKRMASLNASAILAASYSDEKYHCRGSSSSDSSSESEVEVVRRRKQSESEVEKRKAKQGSDPEEVIKQPKKVVILNQDTDVTITGVYVNQTRSTHHEGFCSIAGMQYRISSTSHTQTAATAVATEIHEHPKPEQPCKSYTPLGALSSMQPPGSQGPPHPPMSPRRHSAFSAPHQHDVESNH